MSTNHLTRPPVLDTIFATGIHGHHVIEASAGTGKTFTIMNMVLELLVQGVPLEKILLVTFTDKATVELRSRLRESIVALLATSKSDNPDAWQVEPHQHTLLSRALEQFESAQIYTIHAFANRVLHEYSFMNDLPFVSQTGGTQGLFEQTLHRYLEEHLAPDSSEHQMALWWLERNPPASLFQLLREASSHDRAFRARPVDATSLVATVHEALTTGSEGGWSEALYAYLSDKRVPTRGVQGKRVVRSFEALVGLLSDLSRPIVYRALDCFDFTYTGSNHKYLAFLADHEVIAGVPGAQVCAWVVKAAGALLEHLEHPKCVIAGALLPGFLPYLRDHKRRLGVITFDDMITELHELVSSGPGTVTSELASRYSHAIIDEFQDTDDRQWDIFKGIFLDRGSITVVGDPKQAIYSFRGADLNTYFEATGALERISGEAPISLSTNYRSATEVVELCNRIFCDTPTAWFSGKLSYTACAPGRPPGAKSPLELLPVDTSQHRGTEAILTAHLSLMCRRIAALIHEGAAPEDIFILASSNSELEAAATRLAEHNLPYTFYKREGLFQEVEAHQVLALLDAIAHPWSLSAARKAALTPFFSFAPGDPELTAPEVIPGEELLNGWHALATRGRYTALFESLLSDSGFMERALAVGDSQPILRVTEIFRILREHAESGALSLFALLDHLRGFISGVLFEEGSSLNLQPTAPGGSGGGVQLLTMHKSKGLESKIVFLMGGLTAIPSRDNFITWHDPVTRRKMVGARLKDKSAPSMELAQQAQEQEEQRLLYVALTRASEKLVLPLYHEGDLTTPGAVAGRYALCNSRLLELFDGEALAAMIPSLPTEGRPQDEAATHTVGTALTGLPPFELPQPVAPERTGPLFFSYSSLRHAREHYVSSLSFERERENASASDLPPSSGAIFGNYVHELMEHAPYDTLSAITARQWADSLAAQELADQLAPKYALLPGERDLGLLLCHRGYTTPLQGINLNLQGGLSVAARTVHELEFFLPAPALMAQEGLSLARGAYADERRNFLRGFIDLTFEHEGRLYVLDWKTDQLTDYAPEIVGEKVRERYNIQALIYGAAICKMAGITTEEQYEQRFGGIFYLFLRGLTPQGAGLTSLRPGFDQYALLF